MRGDSKWGRHCNYRPNNLHCPARAHDTIARTRPGWATARRAKPGTVPSTHLNVTVQRRGIYCLITAFWIVMNGLLWRAETRGGGQSEVPLDMVAQRMLDTADTSTLQIRQKGQSIGQLRWSPSILHDDASATNQLADEGMVTGRTGYALDLDVNLVAPLSDLRGRGTGRWEFNSDRSWRSLELHFTQKPITYELFAAQTNAAVSVRISRGDDVLFNENLPWNDPAALLRVLDGGLGGFGLLPPGLLAGFGLLAGGNLTNGIAAAASPNLFRWEAHTAELKVSQQRVRTFQIHARLLNQFSADIWVGRSGELLRILLPGEIELRDESLPSAR